MTVTNIIIRYYLYSAIRKSRGREQVRVDGYLFRPPRIRRVFARFLAQKPESDGENNKASHCRMGFSQVTVIKEMTKQSARRTDPGKETC